MESIDIITGQNIIIRYQPATILQRIGALLSDFFFIIAYLFLINFTLSLVNRQFFSDDAFIVSILLLLPAIGYHFIFESVLGGKTPGKLIAKIKVTKSDGSIPGIGAYFLRWLFLSIDLWFSWGLFGLLFIILSKNHQRLGDMAAGTVVVKTDPSLAFDLDESYYEFPDDYAPSFFHVDRLTSGQIAFITNLLIEPKNKNAVSGSLTEISNKVKAILGVESNLDERKFLETIVRDYNYYAALEI